MHWANLLKNIYSSYEFSGKKVKRHIYLRQGNKEHLRWWSIFAHLFYLITSRHCLVATQNSQQYLAPLFFGYFISAVQILYWIRRCDIRLLLYKSFLLSIWKKFIGRYLKICFTLFQAKKYLKFNVIEML